MAGEFKVVVKITNPDGQEHVTEDAFTFDPAPKFLSITPASGPSTGGTVVVIQTQDADQGAKVFFGDKEALNVIVAADGSSITCTTPSQV